MPPPLEASPWPSYRQLSILNHSSVLATTVTPTAVSHHPPRLAPSTMANNCGYGSTNDPSPSLLPRVLLITVNWFWQQRHTTWHWLTPSTTTTSRNIDLTKASLPPPVHLLNNNWFWQQRQAQTVCRLRLHWLLVVTLALEPSKPTSKPVCVACIRPSNGYELISPISAQPSCDIMSADQLRFLNRVT